MSATVAYRPARPAPLAGGALIPILAACASRIGDPRAQDRGPVRSGSADAGRPVPATDRVRAFRGEVDRAAAVCTRQDSAQRGNAA